MSLSYTVKGKRFQHHESYGSRFGPGKVHLQTWHKAGRAWVILCRSKQDADHQQVFGFAGIHGHDVARDVPVTCKKCLKIMDELSIPQ